MSGNLGNFDSAQAQNWFNKAQAIFTREFGKNYLENNIPLPIDRQGNLKDFTKLIADEAVKVGQDYGKEAESVYLSGALKVIEAQQARFNELKTRSANTANSPIIEQILSELKATASQINAYKTISAQETIEHGYFPEIGKDRDFGDGNDLIVNSNSSNVNISAGDGNDIFLGNDGNDSVAQKLGSDLSIGGKGRDAVIPGTGKRKRNEIGTVNSPSVSLAVGDEIISGGEIDHLISGIKEDPNYLSRTHKLESFSFEESVVGIKLEDVGSVSEYAKIALDKLRAEIDVIRPPSKSSNEADTLLLFQMQGDLEIVITNREKGAGYIISRNKDGAVIDLDIFIGFEKIRDTDEGRQPNGALVFDINDPSRQANKNPVSPTEIPEVPYDEIIELKAK